jgi:acyl-CoA thioester hydrolase
VKASAQHPPDNCSTTQARVLYADTDQMGVAYHATYLRWFEAGRAHYMRARGCSYSRVEREGIQLPVVEAGLTYLRPARYDDVLAVRAWLGDLGRVGLRFDYVVEHDGEELVRGFTRHAAVGPEGRIARLPDEVRAALIASEPGTGGTMAKETGGG